MGPSRIGLGLPHPTSGQDRAPVSLWEASEIFQGAFDPPLPNSLNQIINAVNVNDLKTIKIGGKVRQTSTDVRTGHCCRPTKLTQFALANLKLLVA